MADTLSVGRKTDAAAAAGANGSAIALLKRITLQLDVGGVGTQVEGQVADGGSLTGINPVLVAAQDGSLVQSLLSDSSGRLIVLQRCSGISLGDGLTNSPSVPINDAATAAVNHPSLLYALNPAVTWDRLRSPGLGTLAGGRFRTTFKNTPTVGTGTAYASGDVIGTSNTLTAAARVSGGSGVIRGVSVVNRNGVADIAIPLRIWYFDSSPSSSTFTDNAALSINDTDISRLIGFVDIPGSGAAATGNEAWTKECDLPFVASGTANIFAVIESRGAMAANVSTGDWTLITQVEHD